MFHQSGANIKTNTFFAVYGHGMIAGRLAKIAFILDIVCRCCGNIYKLHNGCVVRWLDCAVCLVLVVPMIYLARSLNDEY